MLVLCRLLGGLLLLAAAAKIWRAREPAGPEAGGGLAFGLEVWAALMAAGEPVAGALAAAAGCCSSDAARVFRRVAEELLGGLPAPAAWSLALEGIDVPIWAMVAQAGVRSERDGVPLSPVLRRLAAGERAAAASRGVVAARRAGVLAVLPLGLCTLPAYVLLSVAPAGDRARPARELSFQ